MNAPLSLTATPAAGTTATNAATARDAGAEGFGDALSTILAAAPSTAATGKQPPAGPGTQDTTATEPATDPAGVDPASAAQAAPVIFQLPVTPASAPAAALPTPAPETDATTTATGTAPATPAAPAGVTTPGVHSHPVTGAPLPAPARAAASQAPAPRTVAAVPADAVPVTPEATPAPTEPGNAGKQAGSSTVDAPVTAPLTTPAPRTVPAAISEAPTASAMASTPGGGQAASVPETPAAAIAAVGAPAGGAPAPVQTPAPAVAMPARVFAAAYATKGSPQPAAPGARATAPAAAADTVFVPGIPLLTSVAAVISAEPAAPAPAVPVPPGFAAQLARPVFTLASAGTGGHTMVVAVHPDSLGPVTVQAHISAAGVRVELFAASADGREVLRQILPDLKRDLAGAGLNASLDLSSGNQPGGGQDAREQSFNRRAAIGFPGGTDSRQLPVKSQASRAAAGLYAGGGSLDVMA